MTQSVELEPAEWQQVITALAMSNPVLVKISTQLSQQQNDLPLPDANARPGTPLYPGNSKEPHHGL